jgi:hypothetical protein
MTSTIVASTSHRPSTFAFICLGKEPIDCITLVFINWPAQFSVNTWRDACSAYANCRSFYPFLHLSGKNGVLFQTLPPLILTGVQRSSIADVCRGEPGDEGSLGLQLRLWLWLYRYTTARATAYRRITQAAQILDSTNPRDPPTKKTVARLRLLIGRSLLQSQNHKLA